MFSFIYGNKNLHVKVKNKSMAIKKTEKQELLEKLELLLKRQEQFRQEINELQWQIGTLKTTESNVEIVSKSEPAFVQPVVSVESEKTEIPKQNVKKEKIKTGVSAEIEKFIGESLINKIGIAVLIIGVGIGAKYAIDNNLISPLMRIILGYLVGFGLVFFAVRLKKKYFNFSTVLFSGAMAIHYFITYAAYTYYYLFPQLLAVILMVIITAITVALALFYDRQVIAHFGLVGACVVPYVLREPFLNVVILFVYILIVNSGILFISFKKKWKPLTYLAFIVTWTIFITWFATGNYVEKPTVCLIFLFLFFVIFYLVFLSYKLVLKEKFGPDDIIFLLLNATVMYTVGYITIDSLEGGNEYLGLFTIVNAIIYGVTTYLIYQSNLKDKSLFFWSVGLVIVFFTATIPIQFDSYITAIIWSVETALIFLYGKSKKINFYEIISYILIFITSVVVLTNWSSMSYSLFDNTLKKLFTPIFNMEFMSSVVVILSFYFIFYVNKKSKIGDKLYENTVFDNLFPVLLLIIIYFSFFTQIALYWKNVQVHASFELRPDGIWEKQIGDLNPDISRFSEIWQINYSLLFFSILSFINFRWFKNRDFDGFLVVANLGMIFLFLLGGLHVLSQLRSSYLSTALSSNYNVSIYHILIRYISIAFFALLLYSHYRFVSLRLKVEVFKKIFDIIFIASIVWISSSELINWLSLSGSTEVYKHGLSILWGVFSLAFIVYGIWKKKKHIRISAIALLGITLIKLFLYDLANLQTVPKTIVFISIGILFLVISFLYNKYKNIIFEEG